MRKNLILWSILLIAGFLAGFIPQHSRAHKLEQKVSASAAQIEACQLSEQLSQLRDSGTLMYLEATQKNYGTSGDDAGRFFDQAQRLANGTQDEAFRNVLREIWQPAIRSRPIWQKGMPLSFPRCSPFFQKLSKAQNGRS